MSQAQELIERGYRRVSNRGQIVARVDRADWKEHMAQRHAPWDPKGEGMRFVERLEKENAAADHYRRVYSTDWKYVHNTKIFRQIPNSRHDPVGYVE